jgi:hypothetical protein
MSAQVSIVWFRQDVQLLDHPAVHAAMQRRGPVIPVFIWGPALQGRPDPRIHQLGQAPTAILRAAGIGLRRTSPWPSIDDARARARALAALAQLKGCW